MIHAICEDYRAAATIDLDDDAADTSARIRCPLQLLWGGLGTVGQLYNVVGTERKGAKRSGEALPCGHSPQEECPEYFIQKLQSFLHSVL